jgi:LysM repeat protein
MTARILVVLCAVALLSSSAQAAEPVHRVARGQTLGSIARRYRVSVEDLCAANGITPKQRIKPGQQLFIPSRDGAPAPRRTDPVRWHTVQPGQRLGGIAARHGIEVEALCGANDLEPTSTIRPGQRLVIPGKDDVDGSAAQRERLKAEKKADLGVPVAGEPPGKSWRNYARPARRGGYVTLLRGGLRFEGYVVDKHGRVLDRAKEKFADLLVTRRGERMEIDERLIQLIAKVSDTFGGRPIDVVSGFRRERAAAGSRHRHGRAIDFRVTGVPNSAVRDYLQTLDRVGVGYYPNSSFVHLDVRDKWTYWVDHSGPGQPARYGGFWTRTE